jgi:hypothetical protein
MDRCAGGATITRACGRAAFEQGIVKRLTNRPSPVGRAGSPVHAVQFAIHANGAHGVTRPTD